MAALLTGYAETGLTTAKFVRRRKSDGAFWNTSGTPAFQSFASGNIAQYGIAATETGATGIYTATDPAEGTEGDCVLVKAAGASLVVSDLIAGARWQGDIAYFGKSQMTESYAADGVAPTLEQAVFLVMQRLTEFSITNSTVTVNKLDGTTAAATLTLNSASQPTSSTRST